MRVNVRVEPWYQLAHDAAGVTFDRFVTDYNVAYSGGGYVYGRWTDTELQARFVGTRIRWIGPKQPGYGRADVYLDGVRVAAGVDCYAPEGSSTIRSVIWESAELADGPHTLRIRLVGQKNPASSGHVVVVDHFELEGRAPSGGGTRVDSMRMPGAQYTGLWIHSANRAYIERGYSYSRWMNATYRASFTGSRISWIGPRTIDYGYAAIYIDGRHQVTLSQHGATGWRYRVWESPALAPGGHTIEIRVLGTKHPSARNTIVVLDAFDIMP